MTREEAIDAVRRAALVRPELIDALTTLAPAVRYEPPTVEEVGDDDLAWFSPCADEWYLRCGKYIRTSFDEECQWLPYHAIPEGGAAIEPLPQYNAVRINGVAVGGRGTGGAPTEGGA